MGSSWVVDDKNFDGICNIFDSHAHYHDRKFDRDRQKLLELLPQNGISKVINVGASMNESKESVELAKNYDFIFASVGVHPYETQNLPDDYLDQLEGFSKHEKVVAVGEIGLDYYRYSDVTKEIQKKVFKEQLSLASELAMPVIIHSREADGDMIDILKQFSGKIKGVVHCFSSSCEVAQILLDFGFYLGFTGVITFKNNQKQSKSLSVVPLNRLLIETDCPYMAPEPYRGQVCNSLMLPRVIEKISDIKNVSCQQVADVTNKNACELFDIKFDL